MKSRAKKIALFAPLAIVGLIVFMTIGGVVVMLLWNWLAPLMFGLATITFWQALGLLVLCRILFGGFGCGGGRSRSRSRHAGDRIADRIVDRVGERLDERWADMSPEERERLRQRVRDRWHGPSGGETAPL